MLAHVTQFLRRANAASRLDVGSVSPVREVQHKPVDCPPGGAAISHDTRPPSTKKKRPSKKMRKKLWKMREASKVDSSSGAPVKLHASPFGDDVATAQPSNGGGQVPTPTLKNKQTTKTNETAKKTQLGSQLHAKTRKKSSKISNASTKDHTDRACAEARPVPDNDSTSRKSTHNNRSALTSKSKSTAKANETANKPQPVLQFPAKSIKKNPKISKVTRPFAGARSESVSGSAPQASTRGNRPALRPRDARSKVFRDCNQSRSASGARMSKFDADTKQRFLLSSKSCLAHFSSRSHLSHVLATGLLSAIAP